MLRNLNFSCKCNRFRHGNSPVTGSCSDLDLSGWFTLSSSLVVQVLTFSFQVNITQPSTWTPPVKFLYIIFFFLFLLLKSRSCNFYQSISWDLHNSVILYFLLLRIHMRHVPPPPTKLLVFAHLHFPLSINVTRKPSLLLLGIKCPSSNFWA